MSILDICTGFVPDGDICSRRFRLCSGAAATRKLAFAAVCFAMVSCMLFGCKYLRPPPGPEVPDTILAAEIRDRIADVEPLPIRVFVLDGRVTLSGFVSSPETKQKIIAVAKSVHGVSRVSDDLQLKKMR